MTHDGDNPPPNTIAPNGDFFAALVNTRSEGIVVISESFDLTYANEGLATLTGIPYEKSVGRPSWDFIHVDDHGLIAGRLQDSIADPDEPQRADFRCLCADGEYRRFEGWATNMLDVEHVNGIVIVMRRLADIEDRPTFDEQSRQTLEGIAGAIDDMLLEWESFPDGTSKMRFVSNVQPLLARVGTTELDTDTAREKIAGMWHSASDLTFAELITAVRTPGQVSIELGLTTPDDDEVLWLWFRANVVDSGRDSLIIRAIASDVSRLKSAERELRTTSANLSTLVDSINLGIVLETAHTNDSFLNAAMRQMLGMPEDGQGLTRTSSSELRDQVAGLSRNAQRAMQLAREVTEAGTAVSDLPYELVDGRRWHVDYVPIHRNGGPADGHLWVVRDVTDAERSSAELAEAHQRAIESGRMKSEFLAMMSHEIRTPINGIIGMAELLNDGTLTDDKARLADLAVDSSQALLATIEDILDYSQAEAGRLERDDVNLSPRDLVSDAVALFEAPASQKGLELKVSVDDDVPTTIAQDATKLRQILLNLIGNAIRFTDEGSVTVTAATQHDDELSIAVTDTGVGIDPESTGMLFEPFVQARDTDTSKSLGGSGLGLAISRRLVNLIGGSIAVESTVGVGSSFTINVPAHSAVDGELATLPPMRESALRRFLGNLAGAPLESDRHVNSPHGRGRVLVVDDNDTNAHLALLQLERIGWQADRAADGVEAIEALQQQPYSVVLMDLGMPRMDGYEATRHIRNDLGTHGRATPVVAMTASVLDGERQRCIDAGMNDYLPKPVRLEALRVMVERWAGRDVAAEAIDHHVLQQLESDIGDRAVVAGAAGMFLDELPGRLDALRVACEARDADNVLATAHALKSSAGYFGANQLRSYCSDMERSAREGDKASCALHLGLITAEIDAVRDELGRYIGNAPAPS